MFVCIVSSLEQVHSSDDTLVAFKLCRYNIRVRILYLWHIYVSGEKLNMERFNSLGVIEEVSKRPLEEIDAFFVELEVIFASPSFTKEEVVEAIRRFIPNFEHEEKGKNLDQKM